MSHYSCSDGFCGASDCARCGDPASEARAVREEELQEEFDEMSIDEKLKLMREYVEEDEIDYKLVIESAIQHSALLVELNKFDNMMDLVCEKFVEKKIEEEN